MLVALKLKIKKTLLKRKAASKREGCQNCYQSTSEREQARRVVARWRE